MPGGAAVGAAGQVWVLVGASPVRSLGPALAVARSASDGVELDRVNVIVDDGPAAGVLARRASQFGRPPRVWQAIGRELVPAAPAPLPVPTALAEDVLAFVDVLVAGGTEPVVEHGRLIGEVLGLEVARVVTDEHGSRLEVGVGRFDREAHTVVSAGLEPVDTLRRVAELVRAHRLSSTTHPLARLAGSGRLRARLVAEPGLVGAARLATTPTVSEAPDLRTSWPAAAVGTDTAGRPVVVVCSVGVDLDLVPEAADIRLGAGPGHRLVLAVPRRDAHPLTTSLAAALAEPAELVPVP